MSGTPRAARAVWMSAARGDADRVLVGDELSAIGRSDPSASWTANARCARGRPGTGGDARNQK
jgi:hypothetical protein